MNRIAAALTVVLLVSTAQAQHHPTPAHLLTTSGDNNFRIIFDGIIVHLYDARRAAIVRGGTLNHRHKNDLVVPSSVVITDLRDYVNQPVNCDDKLKICRVSLGGASIRVVGDDDQNPTPALNKHESFDQQVPKLKSVTLATGFRPEALGGLPSGPFVSFIELTGGTLSSIPFEEEACFEPDHDGGTPKRPFSRYVLLEGKAPGKPVLQVKSRTTSGDWKPIRFTTDANLWVLIDNAATSDEYSRDHFLLNKKILIVDKDVEFPRVVECEAQTKSMTSSLSVGALAGCTNNQWP